jgi:hypothetical protein
LHHLGRLLTYSKILEQAEKRFTIDKRSSLIVQSVSNGEKNIL